MSVLDSGMDIFASPLSPLKQNLFRGMPGLMGQGGQPGTIADTSGGPFTAAHDYGRARVRGSKTPGAGPMGGGQGPLNDQVAMAAMLSAANLSDDEKSQVKDLKTPQQLKDYLAVRNQTMGRQHQVKPQVDLGFGQATAQAQPSIGGPTPQGITPGTMTVSQGRGPNAMSASDLAQWQQNIQGKLGAGESVDANGIGAGPWAQRQPGTQYRELIGQPGFSVGGMTPPAQPQAAANPLATAVQGHLKQFPNSLVPSMQNATPEQIIQQINKERAEGQATQNHQQTQTRETAREQHSDQRHQQDLMLRQLQHQQMLAQQTGDEATVQSLQQRINGMLNPQSQGQQQPGQGGQGGQPVQIADDAGYAQLPSGATFVGPDGHLRRKP